MGENPHLQAGRGGDGCRRPTPKTAVRSDFTGLRGGAATGLLLQVINLMSLK
jgi:hypothetical protein